MNKELLKIFFKPLTVVNKIKKKDNHQIFFYSNLGFRDNVKALYDYLIDRNYNEKFKIVVSINDYEDYKDNAPKNVKFVDNKEGIKHFLKSKYAFYCFGKYPIKPGKDQVVVNLWHGTPLKCLGNLEEGFEDVDYHFFTNVVTASEMYIPIMADIFGCDESEVDVLGYPRNDEMFVPNKLLDTSIRRGCNNLIVWLPTYREYNDDFFIPILNQKELEELNRTLKTHNNRIIIKLHPMQKVDVSEFKFSHIDIFTEEQLNQNNMTVYAILRNADGLISDYSSVYFDYMLLDRPLAFTVSDIKEYGQKRGFIFESPTDYMPGEVVKSKEDVVRFINTVEFNVDSHRFDRRDINELMNKFKDGNSAQRIAKYYIREND